MWSPVAGSKAIHQVFDRKRSTTVDVCTGTAAMKVVSGVLGVLLLHEGRYSLVAVTIEDELIIKFQSEYMQCIVDGLLQVCKIVLRIDCTFFSNMSIK